jgi:hypothetical protein
MNAEIRYIKGYEILEAIEFAKKQSGGKDAKGLGAVKLDLANMQSRSDVTYLPVLVNIINGVEKDGTPKRQWLDLHLMFRKVNTRAKIVSYEERIQQTVKSVTLQFRTSSKSLWINPKTKQEEEDPIGEALDKLDDIIQTKLLMHLKAADGPKKLNWDNTKINMFVQRGIRDKATKKLTKTFEDPLIRVEVKFRPKEKGAPILASALPWQCTIHDANKPRSREKTPAGEPPYEYSRLEVGPEETEAVNYGNIHSLITAGSSITGYINASQISLSGYGISLTPRFTSLIVKKSMGFQANYAAMEGQLDDLGSAHTESIPDEHEGGAAPAKPAQPAKNDFANEADAFEDQDLNEDLPPENVDGGAGGADDADELGAGDLDGGDDLL